jgi:hypothetical protein
MRVMKRLALFLAPLALLFAAPSYAHEAEEPHSHAEVLVDTVSGVTGEQEAQLDAFITSVIVEGRYRVAPGLDVKLFVPFTYGSVRLAGDSNTRTALGNLGLSAEKHTEVGRHSDLAFELLFTAPTAPGDPFSDDRDKRDKYALGEFSGRVRNFEEDEFFVSRRFSIVPRVTFATEVSEWLLSAYVKLPILVRAGGETPSDASLGRIKYRSAAIDGIVALQALRAFGELEGTKGIAAAVGPRLVFTQFLANAIEDEFVDRDRSNSQLGFEWLVKARFGHALLNFGVLIPVAGRSNQTYSHQRAFRIALGGAF